ncbi:hypothetical protein SH1V18_12860 [Vallitalea longa]|uniref:Extracellular solute-binding protein n=1 Tax=Vallitalea longa TaxID=2936439 RepID=A0A9W5Y9W9_9FIRM|nr:extracellular solute-binding protein [Vallitalea longa]GKX28806.1 hypothetical protein SH1V18_12860 [Vallitalea longa]
MGRRFFTKVLSLCLVTCLMVTLFAGCKKEAEEKTTAKDNTSKEKVSEEEYDPLGKYEEPVTVTVALRTAGTNQVPFKGSMWDKKFQEYGINVEVAWSADASQYDNRLNTCIASGDIPDLLGSISAQPMSTLVRGDMIYDVGELFQYLSPTNEKWLLTGAGADAIDSVTIDDKVCIIPGNVTELINNCFPLFIRKDWLDNLGLPIPKTIEDFKNVALAFTKDDPNKNDKDDTYGLTIMGQSNMIVDWGGLYGFFGGYGVQPCAWYDGMLFYSKDSNGNAVWDGTRPEVKEGLQLLQDLYAEDAIAKDFPTMDGVKVMEDLNGGKAGMVFGVRGLPMWAINKTILNDPEAEWYAMNMPTKDGSEAPIFAFQPVNTGFAISKNCDHPEAIIKMLNIVTAMTDAESPLFDPDYRDTQKAGNWVIHIEDPAYERTSNETLFEALKKEDKTNIDKYMEDNYDKIMEYMDTKDPELWRWWNSYYPEEGHAWYLTFGLNKPDMIKKNVWWALPTDSMLSYLPIYKKMAEETMTKIITGNADVSEWDKMVEEWNKLGGDKITKEVQDSLK